MVFTGEVSYRYRKHVLCCERCRWTFYNRVRDEASTQAREKVCGVCGEAFTATRADAKTCSAKCKQKAYRQRRAAPAVVPKTETDKGEIRKKIKRVRAAALRRRHKVDDAMMVAYRAGVKLTDEEWELVGEIEDEIERLTMAANELRDAL
jgi:predicted nucleic acid-binding Zn ribbon protein